MNSHLHCRQRVVALREELEKEEFYVNYLEQLLADVEKQKTRAAGDGEAAAEDASCRTDSSESGIESSEASRKFSKSCSQNSIDLCISELADSTPQLERQVISPPVGSERSISVDESAKTAPDGQNNFESRPRSLTQPNLNAFVTVIEINGKGKKKVEAPPMKFPPKPPPKTFAKPSLDLSKKPVENQEQKKVTTPVVQFPELDPSQLLKEAAMGPAKSNSSETVDKEPIETPTSANEPKSQNNLSKLIDRFSMVEEKSRFDQDPPYGRIKRAAPTPEIPK